MSAPVVGCPRVTAAAWQSRRQCGPVASHGAEPCGTSVHAVELRDDQPMKHEIGNRTYIVADVEPLDVDGVRTVEVGTALWLLGFLALLPFYGRLEDDGHGWWLWTCLAGFGLGLFGLEYCRAAQARACGAARGRPDDRAPEPSGPRSVSNSSRRACRTTWLGQRLRLVRLRQPHLGVGAAAVVEATRPGRRRWRRRWRRRRTSPPAGRRAGPGSRRCCSTAGRRLGERRLGAVVAVVPALGGELAALERERADPAEAELLGDLRTAPRRRRRAGRRRRRYVGTRRGSSSSTGSRSPGERSPGWIRSR